MKKLKIAKYQDSAGKPYWLISGTPAKGKRIRRTFAHERAAHRFLDSVNEEVTHIGIQALSLDNKERIEAAECLEELKKFGKSLREATAFYLEHLKEVEKSSVVSEAIDEFLTDKEREGVSPRHLQDMRHRLEKFCQVFGKGMVAEVDRRKLQKWVIGRSKSSVTQNNYQRILTNFFNWSINRGYLTENPFKGVGLAKVIKKSPTILTPEQLEKLLGDFNPLSRDSLYYALAIQAYAGLRTEEVLRLKWKHINFDSNTIILDTEITKLKERRLIRMEPCLIEIIQERKGMAGENRLIYHGSSTYHYHRKCLQKRVGVKIPDNALRHSCASYHLALYQNAPMTAEQLGHDVETLYRDYREIVSPEVAKQWFRK